MTKIKPIFFILLGIVIFTIGVTYAYFYTRSSFANKFKTSAYDIELNEEFDNDWGTKKVNILNKDSTPVVIRINYNEIWTEKEPRGEILANNDIQDLERFSKINQINSCRIRTYSEESQKYTLSNIINGENVVTKNWTSTWNDFVKGNDGWYYYNKVLESNANIQILDSISLRDDLINESNCYADYNNYEYELSFNYEAIQADVNAIKDIWGHNISINKGDIIWTF